MTGALLYIRVSSPKQGDERYNLPTQQRKVEDRCKHDGLTVLKVFVDVESARTDDRKQFQAMLEYCRQHRGSVTHVVFADLSRLARNIEDQAATLAKFEKLSITPISCDERIEKTAAGKLTVNLLGMVNQFYSDSLSERITFRMAAGVQEGRFLWLAPIGYFNGPKKSGLKIDHERAGLVRQAFEWTATRSYSLKEILRRLIMLGLTTRRANRPITTQTLSRVLRNQVYAGWVVSGALRVKGSHEPIVSQALFDAVQDALDGKAETKLIRKKLNDDFPLKGFVRCAGCDKKLTSGWVKGRKEKYARYWCWNTKCPARVGASRDEIENDFLGLLGMMEPTQQFLIELPRIAETYWQNRLERLTVERKRLSALLADNKTLNQKILLQKVNGEFSDDDFAVLKETVVKQKDDAQSQLAELDAETATMDTLLQDTQNNIVDVVGAWNKGNVAARQELAFSLYPEGLRFSRETKYFEPGNVLLVNTMREMMGEIMLGKSVGAGDGI